MYRIVRSPVCVEKWNQSRKESGAAVLRMPAAPFTAETRSGSCTAATCRTGALSETGSDTFGVAVLRITRQSPLRPFTIGLAHSRKPSGNGAQRRFPNTSISFRRTAGDVGCRSRPIAHIVCRSRLRSRRRARSHIGGNAMWLRSREASATAERFLHFYAEHIKNPWVCAHEDGTRPQYPLW